MSQMQVLAAMSRTEQSAWNRWTTSGDLADLRTIADELASRGDARGALLHVLLRLWSPERLTPEARAQLRARFELLLPSADPTWLHLMALERRAHNCPRGGAPEGPIRFRFQCDQRWEVMTPTDDPTRRVCEQCHEDVFHSADPAVIAARAREGHCVVFDPSMAYRAVGGDHRRMTGRPDWVAMWAGAIFGPTKQ